MSVQVRNVGSGMIVFQPSTDPIMKAHAEAELREMIEECRKIQRQQKQLEKQDQSSGSERESSWIATA